MPAESKQSIATRHSRLAQLTHGPVSRPELKRIFIAGAEGFWSDDKKRDFGPDDVFFHWAFDLLFAGRRTPEHTRIKKHGYLLLAERDGHRDELIDMMVEFTIEFKAIDLDPRPGRRQMATVMMLRECAMQYASDLADAVDAYVESSPDEHKA